MKKRIRLLIGMIAFVGSTAFPPLSWSADITPEIVRAAAVEFIHSTEQNEGVFTLFDEKIVTNRQLKLERVYDRIGITEDHYYVCIAMEDLETGDVLDVDFDVKTIGGTPKVLDSRTRIHKVNGRARYTYDEDNNIIPRRP